MSSKTINPKESGCIDWPAEAGESGPGQARSWGEGPADEGDDARRSPQHTPVGDIVLFLLVDGGEKKRMEYI